VQPFPISVASEPAAATTQDRASVRARLGLDGMLVGLGVERVDYTKGLPERMRAVRRFFERWPEYRRRVVFVQVASPSRSSIPRYQALQQEIQELVKTINEQLGDRGWRPILYRDRHHDRAEVAALYRAADVCLVTSLHDGMNLVAKEFVAARDDDDGVLVLSRFTGASRDLRDALAVNPYDVEGMADAIRAAFEMDAAERRRRMSRMRGQVRERNIYRWAALLLTELTPRGVPVAAE
jgi:trehalose 6-phosphate synthase